MTGHEQLDDIIERALSLRTAGMRLPRLSVAIEDDTGVNGARIMNAYLKALTDNGFISNAVSWISSRSMNFVGQGANAVRSVAENGTLILDNTQLIGELTCREIASALPAAIEQRGITAILCGTRDSIRTFLDAAPGLSRRMNIGINADKCMPAECAHRDVLLMKPLGIIKPRTPRPL